MIYPLQRLLKYSRACKFIKYIHTYLFKMDKAYLRHINETEGFELAFRYVDTELRIDRQFNFNRRLSETVDSFLCRVATNYEKIANKKLNRKKKKNDVSADTPGNEEIAEKKADVKLFVDNDEVPKETICGDIFLPDKKIVLKLESKTFEVIVNSPWIDSISLPTSMLATFPIYPSKFETVFTDKTLSTFTWSKSKDKKTWVNIGSDFMCIPQNEDIDHYLKLSCIPKNSKYEGPCTETISECKVEASPGRCPFEDRQEFTKQRASGNEFRVISYNILADLYCDSDFTRTELHPYCPPYALAIDYRKQLFLKEIIGYHSDIICLQEVDRKIFKYDLVPILNHLDYGGNLALKGDVAEGLAFFYYKKRFNHLESQRVVFSEHLPSNPLFADIWTQVSKNEKLSARILDLATTLQVNVVEAISRKDVLVVANIHLYFHPDADHIRLIQGGIAIRYLEDFVKKLKDEIPDKRISLIFCGDFNSVPECGIYKLYTEGSVPKDFIDYKSNEEEQIQELELQQPFKLGSACGTPKYTNFTAGFADCLDYIYYDTSNLSVAQVVPFPSHDEVVQNTALPSVVFPSDHISLVSDLCWL